MDAPKEVELKLEFAASDRDRLIASPLLGGRSKGKKLRAIYFDTPSFDLRRAGFALRIRSAGDKRTQTIKTADGASLLSRGEWEQPVSDDVPVLDETAGLFGEFIPESRLKRIAPLFTTDIARVVHKIELPGASLVECAIDSGHIIAGNRRMPVAQPFTPTLLEIGGAQRADSEELVHNPRARSAVLRVAEKIGGATHTDVRLPPAQEQS